ncbi:MAG: hypothetical protein AB1801_00145 [Chloroflexota bacterium]
MPGFIDSVNELENLTILRPIKLLLFVTQWLLIDPAERDHDSRPVDYETMVKGSGDPSSGSSSIYHIPRPLTGPAAGSLWPSTSRITLARPPANTPPPPPFEADLFSAGPANGPAGPAARYKDRLRIDNRDYPLVIKRVVASPFNGGTRKVDTVYYDDRLGRWCDIVDEETRKSLARAVEAGLVSVVDPAYWPTT